MANKKKRCKCCGDYGEASEGVQTPSGWFSDYSHAIKHSIELSRKRTERLLAKAVRAQAAEAKNAAKRVRERKMEVKPLSYWMKRAQTQFNKFIRARDIGLPCVSCGATESEVEGQQGWKVGGAWDCGHYLSVGSHPELRFEQDNAARQCKSCNGGSGNYSRKNHQTARDYRAELIKRIGLERVEWLEGPHEPKRYRKEDYQAIEAEYKAKLKELQSIACQQ